MTDTQTDISLMVEPRESTPADKARYIFLKLWASIPEEHLWLADENVDYFEARTGPSWMCGSARKLTTPLRFEDALLEFAYFQSFRAGLLCLSSGGRVYFNLMDEPRYSVRKIEIPMDGEILAPAYTFETVQR